MNLRQLLIGAWRLEVCEARDDTGEVLLPLGPSPVGLLVYDACGVMSVAIMRAERQSFAANDILAGSVEEKARAAETYLSYAGTWEVADQRVRHRVAVSLFPNWVDAVQERKVVLDGDVLDLSTDPITFGNRTRTATMRWRRVRSAVPMAAE